MSNTKKSKIIYAEDQESIARLVNFKLSKEGFDVILLNSGENVLETVLEQKPLLILLDLMLLEYGNLVHLQLVVTQVMVKLGGTIQHQPV
jgi:DNA-binding response OmpR family regulator